MGKRAAAFPVVEMILFAALPLSRKKRICCHAIWLLAEELCSLRGADHGDLPLAVALAQVLERPQGHANRAVVLLDVLVFHGDDHLLVVLLLVHVDSRQHCVHELETVIHEHASDGARGREDLEPADMTVLLVEDQALMHVGAWASICEVSCGLQHDDELVGLAVDLAIVEARLPASLSAVAVLALGLGALVVEVAPAVDPVVRVVRHGATGPRATEHQVVVVGARHLDAPEAPRIGSALRVGRTPREGVLATTLELLVDRSHSPFVTCHDFLLEEVDPIRQRVPKHICHHSISIVFWRLRDTTPPRCSRLSDFSLK